MGALWRRVIPVLAALPLAAQASGLRLSPLRLDLSAETTTTQIQLTNLEAAPLAVQIKAMRWTQAGGQDAYEPTQDIFFAPPIVTVPANGKTVVRFRLRAKAPVDTEGAYRVYFQEIPPADAPPTTGMAFRIRFGVPLFVAAGKPVAAALKVDAARNGDTLVLTLANEGLAHLKVEGVDLFAGSVDRKNPGAALAEATHSEAGTNYLLPHSRHAWRMTVPATAGAPLWLLVRTDDYSGHAAKGMTDRGWLWLPVPEATPAAPH